MRRAQCSDRHVKISTVLVSFTSLKGQLKAADLKYSAFSFPDIAPYTYRTYPHTDNVQSSSNTPRRVWIKSRHAIIVLVLLEWITLVDITQVSVRSLSSLLWRSRRDTVVYTLRYVKRFVNWPSHEAISTVRCTLSAYHIITDGSRSGRSHPTPSSLIPLPSPSLLPSLFLPLPPFVYLTHSFFLPFFWVWERCSSQRDPGRSPAKLILIILTPENASGDNRFSNLILMGTINCPMPISPCKTLCRLGASPVDRLDKGMARMPLDPPLYIISVCDCVISTELTLRSNNVLYLAFSVRLGQSMRWLKYQIRLLIMRI